MDNDRIVRTASGGEIARPAASHAHETFGSSAIARWNSRSDSVSSSRRWRAIAKRRDAPQPARDRSRARESPHLRQMASFGARIRSLPMGYAHQLTTAVGRGIASRSRCLMARRWSIARKSRRQLRLPQYWPAKFCDALLLVVCRQPASAQPSQTASDELLSGDLREHLTLDGRQSASLRSPAFTQRLCCRRASRQFDTQSREVVVSLRDTPSVARTPRSRATVHGSAAYPRWQTTSWSDSGSATATDGE